MNKFREARFIHGLRHAQPSIYGQFPIIPPETKKRGHRLSQSFVSLISSTEIFSPTRFTSLFLIPSISNSMAALASSNSLLGATPPSLFLPSPSITTSSTLHTNRTTAINFPKQKRATTSTTTCAYTTRTRRTRPPSTATTLYDVLGIPTTASCNEIKKAYRRLARVCHPDVVQNHDGNCGAGSDQFMKIHEAYLTLSDPGRRASYDRDLFLSKRLILSMDAAGSRLVSGLSGGYSGRNWETDQCW